MKRKALSAAFPHTIPIFAGFWFLGLAYGIYMNVSGFSFIYPMIMSLIFGMCDETFSINYTADIPEDVDRGWFMFFVTLLNHLYWVSGAVLGGIFGSFISFNTEGLDFVMTAMFTVIFLEQLLKEKNHVPSLLGLGLSLVCLVIFKADNFTLPSMAAIMLSLTIIRKPLEKTLPAEDIGNNGDKI